MRVIETIETFRAPRSVVWAAYSDLDNLPRRIGILDRVERLDGPSFDVGTKWRQVIRFVGVEERETDGPVVRLYAPDARPETAQDAPEQTQHFETELVACAPQRYFVAATSAPVGLCFLGYEFADFGANGCQVRVRCRFDARGLTGRLTMLALGKSIRRSSLVALRRDLQEMRRSIEAEPKRRDAAAAS